MGTTQDHGTPQNDPMAAEWARAAIGDLLDASTGQFVTDDDGFEVVVAETGRAARMIADAHTFTWERDVNEAGVPVRRYVARSAWEVDPAAATGDRSPDGAVLRQVLDEIRSADEFDAEVIVRVVADGAGVVL